MLWHSVNSARNSASLRAAILVMGPQALSASRVIAMIPRGVSLTKQQRDPDSTTLTKKETLMFNCMTGMVRNIPANPRLPVSKPSPKFGNFISKHLPWIDEIKAAPSTDLQIASYGNPLY